MENVRDAVLTKREKKPDMILCTGGMSVDPDDNTPGGIKAAGANIIAYGAPVLPGAMFLLGYFDDGMPVMGLPGCVMYAGATVFDLVLPKIAADVPSHARISRRSAKAAMPWVQAVPLSDLPVWKIKTSKRWRSHRFEGGGQPAARTRLRSHTCRLRGVFCHAHGN